MSLEHDPLLCMFCSREINLLAGWPGPPTWVPHVFRNRREGESISDCVYYFCCEDHFEQWWNMNQKAGGG